MPTHLVVDFIVGQRMFDAEEFCSRTFDAKNAKNAKNAHDVINTGFMAE